MMRSPKAVIATAVLLVGVGAASWAGTAPERPTFTKDVLPIFQRECQLCHRPAGANLSGMIAPMSLMNYREVRPWAKSIAKAVQAKSMPPWFASEQHRGVFENERSLTAEEMQTIVNWANTGAPRGNPKDAPEPYVWPESGWTIGGGEPDLVVTFDEPNWVSDEVDDLYQSIVVRLSKEDMPKDKWLQAIEFKPGSEVVHHIVAFQTTPRASGGMTSGLLGAEAPGTNPTSFPEGFGILVPEEARISFNMHYHKEAGAGTGVYDNSSFAVKFHEKPVEHAITVAPISHGAFEIPPGNGHWKVGGAQTFTRDTTILSYLPHLHLRGAACKYTAYYPDGTSEVLLDVPKYDFNWQFWYEYRDEEPKKVPAGTRIEFEAWYDNSLERASAVGYNGNRPVSFGGPTWDEMDLGWMHYTNTAPMDLDTED